MTKLLALFNPFATLTGSSSRVKRPAARTSYIGEQASSRIMARPLVQRRTVVASNGLSRAWLSYTLVALIIFSSITYIFGINTSAAKGYEIRAVQKRINQLTEDNKKLMLQTAEVGSILDVNNTLTADNFVPVTNPQFITVQQLSQR